MNHILAADDLPDNGTVPLWRDAVVGASVAAMAAATGLGTHYEVGAAPWLSMAAAGVTAVALWGAHRQLGRAQVSEPTVVRKKRARPAPTTESDAVVKTAPATSASPVVEKALATEKPELSTFTPRAVQPAGPTVHAPIAQAQGTGAQNAPATGIAAQKTDTGALPPLPQLDPEAQFLRLQGLVRQLASDVAGARAETQDPDRLGLPPSPSATSAALDAPPFRVGFDTSERVSLPSAQASATPLAQRLAEAVAAERLDVLLEPIQLLAESRARHFEISVRFRAADGDILPVDDVTRVARSTGLAPSIDALKLPRVAKVVQRVLSRGGTPSDVLTALAGASLADHAFMESFAQSFTDGAPTAMVLSFPQADVRAFARVHWSALNALGDMGLRFALNDVTDLDMDFELLRARSFVFAKLDADVFLNGLPCGGAVVPASDICKHIADAGLSLIVARLDTEEQLGRIAEFGVPFGQGRLFGGARPVKSDILR